MASTLLSAQKISPFLQQTNPPTAPAQSGISRPTPVNKPAAKARSTLLAFSANNRGTVSMGAVAAPVEADKDKRMEIQVLEAKGLDDATLKKYLSRPRVDFDSILDKVRPIVDSVRSDGDKAVLQYTSQFDKVELRNAPCRPIEQFPDPQLPEETVAAFEQAFQNIRTFHDAQQNAPMTVETMPGVRCSRISRPIGAVGLYVPGGTAVLPSTALMLAVPAGLAGCSTIVLATPPRSDGSISPQVLWCAKRSGVTHILQAGGAQAVAAMAWGTDSCPKVDKLFGPGNQYVTAAKMLLQNSEAMVAIDMPAGPSEVLVIADAGAPPAHVAADLLSQAEHGVDSQVILLALPGCNVDAIRSEVESQCRALPRSEVAAEALSHSCVLCVESREQAAEISNMYAPEHLIINTEDAESWLPLLDNAGSVFLGRWTPESVGDYASGTNHTLPTYGYARMYSGVNLDSFLKKITVQQLSEAGLRALGPIVAHMAAVEGLDAHKRAVTLRLGLPH